MKKFSLSNVKKNLIALDHLRLATPNIMEQLDALALAATTEGSLNKKTKELIALAVSIALKSKECIEWHTEALLTLNISRQEIVEMLNIVIYMGGGSLTIEAANLLYIFDELTQKK